MSWKSVKQLGTLLLRPPRSWSISGRLTAHHALSACIILTSSAVLLNWTLVKSLELQSYLYIKDQISVTSQILATAESYHDLEKDFEVEYAAREFSKTYARIIDEQGKVLLQTYRMNETVPVASFPPPGNSLSEGKGRWRSPGGKEFFLQSAWVNIGDRKAILQVALDVSLMEKTFKHYRLPLLVMIFVGTALSAFFGAFIVRQGLKPLREMAESTSRISVKNLDARLDPVRWPDELKVMAAAFDEMLDRLKDAFDRLSSHISMLAHELRNPIHILIGEADEALRRPRTPTEYRSVLVSSLEEYGRLSRLIDRLQFIVRLDVGEAVLRKEVIGLNDEIHNLVSFYAPLGEDKTITVDCSEGITLLADLALFRRAVGNLLTNSLQYTPAGGTITIVAADAEDSVKIAVTDTGFGIDPGDLPHVFDLFYRANAARSVSPEGAGLGLAIVKGIVSHHGGSVSIESTSSGTTVTLLFPRQHPNAPVV